ncbi:PAS domain-containing sensor histidine kinase [Spirosoma endbachense]|uniref:histidine kinase n=1 Tax=Spirosoma endbachense TaxID=2666025 RepID=A0A6P1VWK2_9BACT|nr:PAS domain S-box protein [Spirosoma endbachense]QHV96452.1 PAS domain S-box protein [Spirosoma endbachense]
MKKQTTSSRGRKQALRPVERHLATAFSRAAVGLVITRLTGTVIHVNNAFGQLTGYSPDELITNPFGLVMHPDELNLLENQLDKIVTGEQDSLDAQVRCIHKNGQPIWLKLHTTLLNDESGQTQSLFSIIEEITREVVMHNDQQKLLALVDNGLSFMAIADLEGRLTYINEAGRVLVGLDKEDLQAVKFVEDFYSPENYRLIQEVALPILLSQGHWTGRVELKHFKTGEPIPCQASGIRIDDPHSGKPLGRGFTMRDLRPELAAQEMERKLLTLVDNSIELMSILELDGKNSYINKAGIAMLGFENVQQVQQTPIAQLHAPEHFDLVEKEVLPSVMNTGSWSGEMLVRHLKTGEIFPVFNNTIRIDDPYSGQPMAVGAVMRDRRPEMLAQRTLEESELFSRNVFHHSPVAKVVFVGQDMIIRTVNEKMLALLGRDATIIGKTFREAIPELIETPLAQPLEQVFTSGETYYLPEVKIQVMRSDKADWAYYDCIYKALHNTAGAVYGVIVTASDVTGQVVARQKVEEAETALQGAIELAQLGTWEINLFTGQIDYSPRLRGWYGLDAAGPITQEQSVAAIRKIDLPLIQESIARAIARGSTGIYDIEYTVEAAYTGQERILRAQGKAYFDEEGVAYRISGTVQDVTTQRHLQLALEQQVQQRTEELEAINEELAANNEELMAASEEVMLANQRLEEANLLLTRSNQNLEQFAYIASHDLQEPLRKVQQFGDLLINRYGESLGEGRSHLERMQLAARRMSRLIKDLLAFSRISTSPAPTDSVALNEVIAVVLDNLAIAIGETNAELVVDELPMVHGDAMQLEQLFQNLLSNALKFSRPDGSGTNQPPQILVRAHRVRATDLEGLPKPARPTVFYQCIDVIDNGIGFDEKYLDRIFQVFQRLHGKDEFAGTGIGLAICQKVVTNHGGLITARSLPGQGATFSVYLPVLSQ